MTGRRTPPWWAAAVVASLVLAACGSDASGSSKPSPDDLVVQVASFDLAVGPPARFLAGVLTADQRLVAFGSVDMRFSFLGTREGGDRSPAGPVVKAHFLPIAGSTVPDPPPSTPQAVTASQARGVYAAQAGFARAGFWQVEVSTSLGGRARTATGAFEVHERHAVPAPGEQALATENLTLSSADAPRPAIDSRAGGGDIPDEDLHRTTIAAALAAGRPVVAVFSTPVYCVSRFCGPVTDLVHELSRDYGDRASFVHVEIWRDFQNKVVNKAAADWLARGEDLQEPWVFVIGADGRVTARFDNVVNRAELEPLLRPLPVIGAAA
ncbi:MAG: hypothetical protein M3O23_09920 [Actinomycetota bacterium]|nr:hypothetical protein [Actinomycetota bacterium]